jgi:hypothetical protein
MVWGEFEQYGDLKDSGGSIDYRGREPHVRQIEMAQVCAHHWQGRV